MFGFLFQPKAAADAGLWHKCDLPVIPRRDALNGGLVLPGRGQVWRRFQDGKWQYTQDDVTVEDLSDHIW